jgi:RimJ/RimL family protein N-acetyltransferase
MFPDLLCDDVFRLETQRLWLRWPRAADAAAIARFAGDRDVAAMTEQIPHPYPPGAAAEFILQARAGNVEGRSLVLVMALKQRPSDAIGCIELSKSGEGEATLGYWLAKPYWKQGLTSEAVRSLLGLAAQVAGLKRVHAVVRAGNLASRRLLEACGFESVGSGLVPSPARGGMLPVERFQLNYAGPSGASVEMGVGLMQMA